MSAVYIDEEDILGFPIWVAELELILGSARGKSKADPVQCFQLLQKLVVTLDRTDRNQVRAHQRRCEDALIDVLLKGAPPPVRRLICEALNKLYSRGDQLPLYARASALQLFLSTKEAASKETAEDVRVGALECMTALYYSQGKQLSIGVHEIAQLGAKYVAKWHAEPTRTAALRLLASAVEGVGSDHRLAQEVQDTVLRTIERTILKESKEAPESVKIGCANCIRALASEGGACFWRNSLSGFEALRLGCLPYLDESNSIAVRDAFAVSLGEMTAAAHSHSALATVTSAGKQKYQEAQKKALEEALTQAILSPFVDAAISTNKGVMKSLAIAWVAYLHAYRRRHSEDIDETIFIDEGIKPLAALGLAANAGASERPYGTGDAELGTSLSAGDRPYAQACIIYILRAGVIEVLGEAAQRVLLGRLGEFLGSSSGNKVAVDIVVLEAIALLLEIVGEAGEEAGRSLEPQVASKLVGSQTSLRSQAAATLGALAVAEPGNASRLLAASLTNLKGSTVKLEEASIVKAKADRSRPSGFGTPRGLGSGRIKLELNAVHGWALGAAALLVASIRLPLGVPSKLIARAMDITVDLVSGDQNANVTDVTSSRLAVQAAQLEAGYILLGALCLTLPAEQLAGTKMANIARLWETALSAESARQLESVCTCAVTSGSEHTAAQQLWWRACALEALGSFLKYVIPISSTEERSDLCQFVATTLLEPMVAVTISVPHLEQPVKARGGPGGPFASAAALFQLRLCEAYLAMPLSSPYIAQSEQLLRLCLKPVQTLQGCGGQPPLDVLKDCLDHRDSLLGPWTGGTDPLEGALLTFEAAPGAPSWHPWEIGLRQGVGYQPADNTRLLENLTVGPFPQRQGPLAMALLRAQVSLLGTLCRMGSPEEKSGILDSILGLLAQGDSVQQRKKDTHRRQALVVAAVCLALSGAASSRSSKKEEEDDSLASKYRSLAQITLDEALAAEKNSAVSVALLRSTADLYACAAAIGSHGTALSLVKALCRDVAGTSSLVQRAALALSIGSVSCAVGGLSLQAVIQPATETLLAVAEASDASIAPWMLHSLLCCANAAGLAFLPHVSGTLALAQRLLLSESVYFYPGVLPAIGRLANAMVAVLGPEYTPGSPAYIVCKSIINYMKAVEDGMARGSNTATSARTADGLSASLEIVLYAQMLVLFAPHAAGKSGDVASRLVKTLLLSRRPRIRKVAADTLRHLAERDALEISLAGIEHPLFATLDYENDPGTAAQIRAIILTLVRESGSEHPSKWVDLCWEVITAGSSSRSTKSGTEAPHIDLMGDSEEEEGEGKSKDDVASGELMLTTPRGAGVSPRLRTRMFAASILLELPELVCSRDPSQLQITAGELRGLEHSDKLALKLQKLVDLGFKLASGSLEALRPVGIDLLARLIDVFGAVQDPLAEEGMTSADGGYPLLMQLYQAQMLSSLRMSLALDASPPLRASGATLAVSFLEKKLAGGDRIVLEKLMALLTAPLLKWSPEKNDETAALLQPYGEWVEARAKTALLQSHAHCTLIAADPCIDSATQKVVIENQRPHRDVLTNYWLAVLKDFVIVCSQPESVRANYSPALWGLTDAPTEKESQPVALMAATEAIKPTLQKAWPAILEASCIVLSSRLGIDEDSQVEEKQLLLLEYAYAGVCIAVGELPLPHGNDDSRKAIPPLAASLSSLQILTAKPFLEKGWMTPEIISEVAGLMSSLVGACFIPLLESHQHGTLCAAESKAVLAIAQTLSQLATATHSFEAAEELARTLSTRKDCLSAQQLSAMEACLNTMKMYVGDPTQLFSLLSLAVDLLKGSDATASIAATIISDIVRSTTHPEHTEHVYASALQSLQDAVALGYETMPLVSGMLEIASTLSTCDYAQSALNTLKDITEHDMFGCLKVVYAHLEGLGDEEWTLRCIVTVVPGALIKAAEILNSEAMSQLEQEIVLNTLKLLVLGSIRSKNDRHASQLVKVILPLLIQAAGREPLRIVCVQMLTTLATSSSATIFKEQVSCLNSELKQKLQSALQPKSTTVMSTTPHIVGPTIKLKSFKQLQKPL